MLVLNAEHEIKHTRIIINEIVINSKYLSVICTSYSLVIHLENIRQVNIVKK